MTFTSSASGVMGGRRSGGRVKTSRKKPRGAGGKAKTTIKIKGNVQQVRRALKTLAKPQSNTPDNEQAVPNVS